MPQSISKHRLYRFLPRIVARHGDRDYYADATRGLLGKKDPRKRVHALLPLAEQARDKTVLDLGCAEGLMLQPFLAGGARLVHGVDESYRRIVSARRFFGRGRSRFNVVDLNKPRRLRDRSIFLPHYDIVLFLGVYQHLDPAIRRETLGTALEMARQVFVMRCPRPLLEASCDTIGKEGFKVHVIPKGSGSGALAVCHRMEAAAA